MKQKLFSLLLLVSLVVSFACSDDEGGPKSSFTVGNTKYALTDGEYYSQTNGEETGYYVTLSALTSKLYNEFRFAIGTTSGNEIPVGTFSVEDEEIYISSIAVVELATEHYIEEFYGAESGEVVISKSGSTYTITFDIVIDGEHVTGTYKGKIELSNNQ